MPADKDDSYNHPRKVKKWLGELKQANMGEFTRQIYNGLMRMNRQAMPAKYRLESMEMLREPVRYIFNQLHKHFVNRTLPLPEKSLKIIMLNQALLNEMATGYKIMIFEAANDLNKVDGKTLLIASERALHYMAELLLRSGQIYSEIPKGFWWDTHRIYTLALNNKLQEKTVKDAEIPQKSISIEDYYKHILMFSLARPHSLRQNDADRVFKAMPEWIKHVNISTRPLPNKLNRYYCSRLDSDLPPNCFSEEDLKDVKQVCTIETLGLVSYLRKQINDTDSFSGSITIGDQVSQETLRTLVTSWSMCAKRRFSRAERQGDIRVSIGLNAIYEKLTTEATPPKPLAKKPGKMFSLEAIPEHTRAKGDVFNKEDPSFFITHPNLKASREASGSNWDMVAKGRSLTESYARELQSDDDLDSLNKEAPDLHWVVSNVSAGGYCLKWNSSTTSRAQVGEIISIREREPDLTYQWRVGVIRWMQYTLEQGLEIGVQILSPKVIACTVQRMERKNEEPFKCLMLPGIKPIQQPSTLLLPAHAFRKDNLLKMHVYDRDIDIKLGTIREHTGSFTQFQFAQLNEDDKGNNNDNNKKSSGPDDFDSIWSSL
ncbi:MAG: hypothetical protein EP315_04595 [Gammaproteobacteria bacterium]|nr:MAG: hypothetical protein EP315_04595 [Gammaproteobacteria bacterium]